MPPPIGSTPPALLRRVATAITGVMLLLNSTVFRVQKDIHVTPTDNKIQVFETKSGSTILSKGWVDINGNASFSGSVTANGVVLGAGGGGTGITIATGDARYVKKQGDTMTGTLAIRVTGGNPNTLGLRIENTGSGRHLHAQQTLTSSGGLSVDGSMSGYSLAVSNLQNCNTIDTNSSGVLSCGTDEGGAGGLTFATAEGIYVNQAGDTMTGALVVNVTGGNQSTLGIRVINTLSGAVIRAMSKLTSSGSLFVEDDATATTVVAKQSSTSDSNKFGTMKVDTSSGTTAVSANHGTTGWNSVNIYDDHSFTEAISLSVRQDATQASIDVYQPITQNQGIELLTHDTEGSQVFITESSTQTLMPFTIERSNGNDVFTVSASGGVVANEQGFPQGSVRFEGDTNVNLFYANAVTDRVGILTNAPLVPLHVAGSGAVTARLAVGGTAAKTELEVFGRMSGASLTVNGTATITGALLVKGNVTTRGTLSGSIIHADNQLRSSGTLLALGNGTIRGIASAGTATAGIPRLILAGDTNKGFYYDSVLGYPGYVDLLDTGNTVVYTMRANLGMTFSATHQVAWASGSPRLTGPDIGFKRQGAGIVQVTNGSTGIGDLWVRTLSGALAQRTIGATTGSGVTLNVGTGRLVISVPKSASGYNVTGMEISVGVPGTTNASTFSLTNLRKGNRHILSTFPSIPSGGYASFDAGGTQSVVNTANDDVSGGDTLLVNITSLSTTKPKILNAVITLLKP